MLSRIINPVNELFACRNRPSRVVWKTEIDDIDVLFRRLGYEIVLSGAWQIHEPFKTSVLARGTGVPRHHVRVDVNRIYRIGDRDLVLVAQNIQDETAIAFGSVRNENLVVSD